METNLLTQLVIALVKNGISKQIYNMRANILTNIFNCELTNQNVQVRNAACCITDLINKINSLFKDFCKQNLIIFIDSSENLSKDSLAKQMLDALSQVNMTSDNPTPYLIYETHALINIELILFPEVLLINGQIYHLRGAILYYGDTTAQTVGHFIAYCKRAVS